MTNIEAETITGKTIDTAATAVPAAQITRGPATFARDENGQISILIVLCAIPFVFLVAFIFNSASQTSRKIEMQGAADAAAVASAVTMARAMNLMVLNNNSMADVLSIMVIVRAVTNTCRVFFRFRTATAFLACASIIGLAGACEEQLALAAQWRSALSFWERIDDALNQEYGGLGWKIMELLDGFNKRIKIGFPIWAMTQARTYAKKNGANWGEPYGFILPGKSDPHFQLMGLQLPIPTLPVGRGPEQEIAERAWNCHFSILRNLSGIALLALSAPFEDLFWAAGLYEILVVSDFGILKGGFDGWLGGVLGFLGGHLLDLIGGVLGIDMLEWSDDPPKPMLLTDEPRYDMPYGNAETDLRHVDEGQRNNLRPYLQFLGFALRDVPRGSPIGGERFLNKPNNFPGSFGQLQFTFGEADVYNPTDWDMWTQDWRAQLTRAKLFDEKVNSLLQMFDFSGGGRPLDWSFVNTH
jgi:hypothetical protein